MRRVKEMKDLSSTYPLEASRGEAAGGALTGTGALPDKGALSNTGRLPHAARLRFLYALLLCTWIPMLFFISVAHLETTSFSIRSMKSLFLFLGTAHVPATFFFYTDRNFSHIVRQNRARYIYFPLILTISAGLLVAFSSLSAQAYLFLAFWAWQAFHYGRQNLGIYSFASIAQRGGAPARLEKVAIDLATLCGVLGTFRVLGMDVAPEYLRGTLDNLYRFGLYGYLAVAIFGLFVYAKNFRRTTPLKSIFFWTLLLFFLPIYLSHDINVTFLSYAIAHGLQYIVFMGIVSLGAERSERAQGGAAPGARYGNALVLVGLMVLLGLLFYNADAVRGYGFVKADAVLARLSDFLFGAVLGATMAHFVIDAGAWRLSRLPQREYMTKRFGFILGAKDAGRT
jgi:hypothetical protein